MHLSYSIRTLVLKIGHAYQIELTHVVVTADDNSQDTLVLCGVAYHNDVSKHYVSHIINMDEKVWYHDGMEMGTQCIYEGVLTDFDSNTI
jgi:hypothetical protein